MSPSLELALLLSALAIATVLYVGAWWVAFKVSDLWAARRRQGRLS